MSRKPLEPMPMAELLAIGVTTDLPTAARALRIPLDQAYRMAREGTFPAGAERYGRNWSVKRAGLFRALGLDPAMTAAPAAARSQPRSRSGPRASAA
jgi:hypothetical protein